MEDFLPFMTGDYSIGLYSTESEDIYHSVYGALSESYDKFVSPLELNEFIKNKDSLSVLDICYGIGYNTKVLLNEIIKNKILIPVKIDCVEKNSDLIKLSPFIKSKINFLDRLVNKKYLLKNLHKYKKEIIKSIKFQNNKNINMHKFINIILLISILDKFDADEVNSLLQKLMNKNEYHVFFDSCTLKIIKNLLKNRIYSYQKENKSTYLHNIYYENILNRYKLSEFYNNLSLNFYNEDIRTYIKGCTERYDIIFLDGFTPIKCPVLWSVELMTELYNRISDNGLLLTYNTSAIARNTLKLAGFNIGYIKKHNNIIGTIASKNKKLIKYPLNDKDSGLLLTKAGIPFRDNNFNSNNEIILYNREKELTVSDLETASSYLKRVNNEI